MVLFAAELAVTVSMFFNGKAVACSLQSISLLGGCSAIWMQCSMTSAVAYAQPGCHMHEGCMLVHAACLANVQVMHPLGCCSGQDGGYHLQAGQEGRQL